MDEIKKKLEKALNKYYQLRMPGHNAGWCYAGSFKIKNRTYSYVSEATYKIPCIVTVRCVKHEFNGNNFANHNFYINRDLEENKISLTTL